MPPAAGLGPLASFTKDWILTAKGGDILKRLTLIYFALSKLEQRDEGAAAYSGLDAIAAGISESNEIRLSKDPEVRLMLSCVVAELFRLCAPDPPFPTPITLDMFKLMSKDLAVLGNMDSDVATMRQQATVVLKSLAEVRSPLILVMMMTDTELDSSLRYRAESVLLALWDCLLGAMRAPSGHTPGTPKQIEDLVLSIITAGLDEMDVLPPKCVDKLLGWLLKSGTHPRGAQVAGEALRSTADRIGQPLAQYILAVLAGKQPGIDGTEDMDEDEVKAASQALDVKDRITALKVVLLLPPYLPAALDPIIAYLAEEIEKTDLAIRVAAVETLGGLFAGPAVSLSSGFTGSGAAGSKKALAELHVTTFTRWLRRFTDTDKTVRALMCRLGSVIVREHPSLAVPVCEKLESRMVESEDLVRHEAVHAACDILVWSLKHAPMPLVKAVAHACKDKNLMVRKEAATGLAQAYGTHMPALWRRSEEWMSANPIPGAPHSSAKGKGQKVKGAGEGTGFNSPASGCITPYAFTPAEQDSWDKLSIVPSAVLALYGQPEAHAHQLCVQLLDTIMLPDKIKGEVGTEAEDITEQTRARGLMFLYCSLSDSARRAFSALQTDRKAVQEAVRQLCTLRAALAKLRPTTLAPGKAANATNAANAAAVQEIEEKLERVHSSLIRYAGGVAPDVELKALRKFIAAVGDQKVFRCLEKLMDPSSPLKKLHLDREELTQTLAAATVSISAPAAASKKAKGADSGMDPQAEAKAIKDIIRQIVRKGTLATCTAGMVAPLLSFAREHVATGRRQEAALTLALCRELVGTFPTIVVAPAASSPGAKGGTFDVADDSDGSPLSQALTSLLSLACLPLPEGGAVVQGVLNYLAVVGNGAQPGTLAPCIAALPVAIQSDVRTVLLNLSLRASPSLAKRAVYAAVSIFPTGDGHYRYGARAEDEAAVGAASVGAVEPMDGFFSTLSSKIREDGTLSCSNPYLSSVLHALGALALRAPHTYGAISAGTAAGKGAGSSPSSVVLTNWLLDHVQSDPEDDPSPAGGEQHGLACAMPWHAAVPAYQQGDEGTQEQDSEGEGGEDGAEDDDEDDGFVRRKKGVAKGVAGVKRKADVTGPAQGPSKKGVGASSAPAASSVFKGMSPSFSTLTRCLSLRVLGCIARGQGCKSLYLMEVGKVLGQAGGTSASPAGGGNSPQLAQLSKAAADSTKAVLDPLLKACASILESGGSPHSPQGKQSLPSSAAMAGASSAASSAALRSAGTSPSRSSVVSGVGSSATPISGQPAALKRGGAQTTSTAREVNAACMRLAVACTLLRILRDVPRLDGFISPGLYRDLCHSVLDPHAGARRAACHALCKTVTKAGPALNIRYMAALPLAACMPDSDKDVKNEAKDALTFAATACMRNSQAYLKAVSGLAEGDNAKMLQQAYTRRPELAVFFTLYLLAHDSPRAPAMTQLKEFEKSLKGAGSGVDPAVHARKAGPALREHTAALSVLVDCTLDAARKTSAGETATASSGCLSLLNSLYTRLGGYEDATSAPGGRSAQALEALRALFFYAIKAHMNNTRAFDKHPAEAYLPVPTLFRPKAPSA